MLATAMRPAISAGAWPSATIVASPSRQLIFGCAAQLAGADLGRQVHILRRDRWCWHGAAVMARRRRRVSDATATPMATGGPRSLAALIQCRACCRSRSPPEPSPSRRSHACGGRREWRAGPSCVVAGAQVAWSTAAQRCCSCAARRMAISISAAPTCTWRRTRASRLGVVARGVQAIMLTGWLWMDPAISLAIAAVVLAGGWGAGARQASTSRSDGVPARHRAFGGAGTICGGTGVASPRCTTSTSGP